MKLFAINFLHTFNFAESDSIPIHKIMFFILMQVDNPIGLLGYPCNVHRLRLLTCPIDYFVVLSKIDKNKPIQSKIPSINEANIIITCFLVKPNQELLIIIVKNNHTRIIFDSEYKTVYINSTSISQATSTTTPGFSYCRYFTEA